MKDDFFQEFLKLGLFDIGDKDERLKDLQNSINDLESKLESDFTLLPKYTLVSLDSEITDSEPALKTTEEIVTSHWQALRAVHNDMPIQIHRGVIINALYNVGLKDPIAARIIYLAGIDFYPQANLGKEKNIVKGFLEELGEIAERHALEEWSIPEDEPSLRLSTLRIEDLDLAKISVDKSNLKEKLHKAVQKNPETGHGSNNGGNSTWGRHFAEKSSEGISEVVNESLTELIEAMGNNKIASPLNDAFKSFKSSIKDNIRDTFSTLHAVQRRSKLVWWKEALYSSSKKTSYRDIQSEILPIVLVSDLTNILPTVTPISVDYFLKETFLLIDSESRKITLKSFLENISSYKDEISIYFPEKKILTGRICFYDFIILYLNDEVSISDFEHRTGLKPDFEIAVNELLVIIFHSFLIKSLSQ